MPSRLDRPVDRNQYLLTLQGVGVTPASAAKNGDCFLLSAMAAFEFSVENAHRPTEDTTEEIRRIREAAVRRMTGDVPIFGIAPATFRAGEGLPVNTRQAFTVLRPWCNPRHWRTNERKKSSAFMLALGLHPS